MSRILAKLCIKAVNRSGGLDQLVLGSYCINVYPNHVAVFDIQSHPILLFQYGKDVPSRYKLGLWIFRVWQASRMPRKEMNGTFT